jgi:hypothetical protein
MFKTDDVSQNFITTPNLYCVWIRATETPGAPLIAVWVDWKMRTFEAEGNEASVNKDCPAADEAEAFDSRWY